MHNHEREYGNRIHLHLENALLPNKMKIAKTKKYANDQIIEQHSEKQGRRRCLAAGVLDIWLGTDPPDPGTAQQGTSLLGSPSFSKLCICVTRI